MVSTKKNSRNHRDGQPHALKSRGDIIFETVVVIILAILTLIILYPLYFVVIASFSDAKLVVAGEVWWYPEGGHAGKLHAVLYQRRPDAGLSQRLHHIDTGHGDEPVPDDTVRVSAFAPRPMGRNGIMIYCTIPMFFGGGLIPTYLMVTQTLGLKNSWWAVILVAGIATYNMIIMRTFFMTSIPFELQEAAQIDGCTPIGILLRIILPLSIPVICVIGLYYGVNHWNSYFSALVYLPDKNKWPLAVPETDTGQQRHQRGRRRRELRRNGSPCDACRDDQVFDSYPCQRTDAHHIPVCTALFCKGRYDRFGKGLNNTRNPAGGMPVRIPNIY